MYLKGLVAGCPIYLQGLPNIFARPAQSDIILYFIYIYYNILFIIRFGFGRFGAYILETETETENFDF